MEASGLVKVPLSPATLAAVLLLAIGAFCLVAAAPAAAANSPPREGCGAQTVAQETAGLNITFGTQGRYFAVNVTLCDVDEPWYNLTVAVESNPASGWSEERNASGSVMLFNTFPGNDLVGYNFFNVTECDSLSACTVIPFHVWIENVNDAPVFITTGETRYATQGEGFSMRVEVIDPDDDSAWLAPTHFSWSDDTSLFVISSSGRIGFTPTNGQVRDWPVTVHVTDDGTPPLSAVLSFHIIVNNTNDPPVLPPYADLGVTQDVSFTAPFLKALDPDMELDSVLPPAEWESLIYTDNCPLFDIVRVDQVNPVSPFNREQGGSIRITATNGYVGDYACVVTVTDRQGLTDTVTIAIHVNNVNDAPFGLRVIITDVAAGVSRNVTVDNSKVVYAEDNTLQIQVQADDPDLRMRYSDPSTAVDPDEYLTFTTFASFVSELAVPPAGSPEKPLIDPSTGYGEFTPGNNEVGTFTITVVVRDRQFISATFHLKLQIENVNDEPAYVRIVQPSSGFHLEDQASLSLLGSAGDLDTADSELTYAWKVEVTGGLTYRASGKSATVQVRNTLATEAHVLVTITVTDNADPSNPFVVSTSVSGMIAAYSGGLPPPPPPPKPPLLVNASFSTNASVVGALVHFSATSSGGDAPLTYSWQFGDGASASGSNAAHAYAEVGDYTVRVGVTDASGATAVAQFTVSVQPAPTTPPPPPTGPAPGAGEPVVTPVATAQGAGVSFEVAVAGGTPPLNVTWKFGDGSAATGTAVSHTYASAGTYTVSVTVTDADGRVSARAFNVTAQHVLVPGPTTQGSGFDPLLLVGLLAAVGGVAAFQISRRRK